MRKGMLIGYYKNKFNIVIILLLAIITTVNYYGTYLDWKDLREQVANSSVDLNIDAAKTLLTGYNGLSYFGNLLFSSDFFMIVVIIMIMGFSVILSSEMHHSIRTGYGNLIVVRSTYKRYVKEMIAAQIAYVCTFVWLFFISLLGISCVIWPANWNEIVTTNVSTHASSLQMLTYCFMHIVILNVYLCALYVITNACTAYIKNRFALQVVPLAVHFIPILLASTLGNVNDFFAKLFMTINTDVYLFTIKWILTADSSIGVISMNCLGITGALGIAAFFLYRKNCARFEGEFIL